MGGEDKKGQRAIVRINWFAHVIVSLVILQPVMVWSQNRGPQELNRIERARLGEEIQRQAHQQAEAAATRRDMARKRERQSKDNDTLADITPISGPKGGPCFTIHKIHLTGYEVFSTPPTGYKSLIGTCATAADIAATLNQINAHYRQAGYITTRAYLPEQDISDGTLEVTVLPGQLEGYVYSDGRQADLRIKTAFPGQRGDLVNLRELEQGLENMNSPRSASSKFRLIPGEKEGGSFVQVFLKETRQLYGSLEANNTGFESTGLIKQVADIGIDNLFGMNDQFRFGVTTTTPFVSRSQKYSDSFSASFLQPFRNWSFGGDIGASRYYFILDGINQSYPVSGRSYHGSLFVERLLMRGQKSKFHGYGDLKLTRTKSFIDHFEIMSQRRHLTIAGLGLRGEHRFLHSRLEWDIGTKFGLDLFDSYVLAKSIVNPRFKLVRGRLRYEHALDDRGTVYKGTLSGQYSNDITPGTEQFFIGGWSNVRGFHDDSMYGDSGIYLRNTLEWNAFQWKGVKGRMNVGFDIGYVKPSSLRSWSQDYLIGASIGMDVHIRDQAKLTLKLAHALSRPDENLPNALPAFEASRMIGYAGLKITF